MPKVLISKSDVIAQQQDTENKFQEINELVKSCVVQYSSLKTRHKVTRLDKLFVHPIWGYTIFLLVFSFSLLPRNASPCLDKK